MGRSAKTQGTITVGVNSDLKIPAREQGRAHLAIKADKTNTAAVRIHFGSAATGNSFPLDAKEGFVLSNGAPSDAIYMKSDEGDQKVHVLEIV